MNHNRRSFILAALATVGALFGIKKAVSLAPSWEASVIPGTIPLKINYYAPLYHDWVVKIKQGPDYDAISIGRRHRLHDFERRFDPARLPA